MFSPDDIRTRLRRAPFVPLRVTTSAGESFDIRHPDFAFLTRRYLEIGEATPEVPDIPDRVHAVAIMHITSIADLPVSTGPATSNGSGG